jgi:hypothetical protein
MAGSGWVEVRVTDWAAARAWARPIRLDVFVEEQGVPVALEWDAHDELSEHAVAFERDGTALGTGRLLPDGHIGRMAVRAGARGRGIGGAILQALIARAQARGMREVVLNAQTHAAPFYARHGFEAIGAGFVEAGIPHVEMRLRLGSTPG